MSGSKGQGLRPGDAVYGPNQFSWTVPAGQRAKVTNVINLGSNKQYVSFVVGPPTPDLDKQGKSSSASGSTTSYSSSSYSLSLSEEEKRARRNEKQGKDKKGNGSSCPFMRVFS